MDHFGRTSVWLIWTVLVISMVNTQNMRTRPSGHYGDNVPVRPQPRYSSNGPLKDENLRNNVESTSNNDEMMQNDDAHVDTPFQRFGRGAAPDHANAHTHAHGKVRRWGRFGDSTTDTHAAQQDDQVMRNGHVMQDSHVMRDSHVMQDSHVMSGNEMELQRQAENERSNALRNEDVRQFPRRFGDSSDGPQRFGDANGHQPPQRSGDSEDHNAPQQFGDSSESLSPRSGRFGRKRDSKDGKQFVGRYTRFGGKREISEQFSRFGGKRETRSRQD